MATASLPLPASLGAASLGAASLGAASLGAASLGAASLGAASLGAAASFASLNLLASLAVVAAPEKRPAVVSSGFRALDAILPDCGLRLGSLVEWLVPCGVGERAITSSGSASGGITLACAVAVRGACAAVQFSGTTDLPEGMPTIVVVDRQGRFHPPAVFGWLESLGMKQTIGSGGRCRLIVARPSKDDDESWAVDQALRCPGVAAVVAWPRRIHPTAMRRWQLAARSSGAVGLIARKADDRREPSWAHVRLAVSPVTFPASGVSPASGMGVRAWRVSTVAGPIDFEERSAVVELDLSTGLEVVHEPGSREIQARGRRLRERGRREAFQCHAS